jgi:preprotein translocase subunit SecB
MPSLKMDDIKTKAGQRRIIKFAREASKFRVSGIRLSESHSKLGKIKLGQLPNQAKQHFQLQLGVSDDAKSVIAIVEFKLEVSYQVTADTESAVTIAASFMVEFAVIKPPAPKSLITDMVPTMAIGISWPYWREFVSSMATRMGLPALPIPILDTAALLKETKAK